jgi:hypothetical protein
VLVGPLESTLRLSSKALTGFERTELSDSRKQLAFNYKLAFERHKEQNSPHAG